MSTTFKILVVAYLGLVTAVPEPQLLPRDDYYTPNDIITRDVCVIGGGSSGAYTAIRLREEGKSVVVVEKENVMGGHTNTFTVPSTGQTIDYGVVDYHNITVVNNYFDHFNIALAPVPPSLSSTFNVDFRTGDIVADFTAQDPTAALEAYTAQLLRYPFLATGINLPSPVPPDLLLPLEDFVTKYNLSAAVSILTSIAQGQDNIKQPTLYTMKLISLNLLQSLETGFIATAAHDNHLLYDAAAAELSGAGSLLLSSYAVSVKRNLTGQYSIQVVVQTPGGRKLIQAKKLVVAIPPRLSNFHGWDLDQQETDIFESFVNEAYYTGLMSNSGIPDGVSVVNVGSDTPFNLPVFPAMYAFEATSAAGLVDLKYASTFEQTDEVVKQNMLASLERLRVPNITTTPKQAEFVAFKSHTPFFEHVSTKDIAGGFYARANKLQGHQNTWYTGAAWEAYDSSMIWNFTEALVLPGILA